MVNSSPGEGDFILPVTISRDNLEARGYDVERITDEQMKELAYRVGRSVNDSLDVHIDEAAEWMDLPRPGDSEPEWVQTSCAICGQDIEGQEGGERWTDRAGDSTCVPYTDYKTRAVVTPPAGTKHRPIEEEL